MAPDPVAGIDLIGVRFDGMGRSPGQAGAPQALRAAGLETALPAADLTSDIILPAPASARGPAGFINEAALLVMVDTVCSRVGHSLRTGRFPLLYGADCAVLLGAIPALRDTAGRAGLLFIDAHEDATAMEQSDTGEAASMEIALLLGLTGTRAPEPLRNRLPALDRDTIVMLGQRDHLYRRQIGVPTIAGQVPLHPLEELRGDLAGIAADAAEHLVRQARGWWLHIDLDVLAGSEFPACDAATDPATPGGLTWTELVTVTTAALRAGGCRGCSIGVYNTNLDPGGHAATRIVPFAAGLTAHVRPG
ncbi:MAG TPA: arginase family protein [Streptosporangiaceae bacterium]|nr:arginase family protein [Streptosporangiaceae bacterium]